MTSFFSRLNPLPFFPSYTGPYHVASTDVEIPAVDIPCAVQQPDKTITTLSFRIYYPCTPPAKANSKHIYWISLPQRSILSGYARFLGANPRFASIFAALPNPLYHVTIPAERDAPLADPASESSSPNPLPANTPEASSQPRWPTLILSHGLGGSRNAYSHLCGSLASHGMIVVAPDHRDGSQPIAFMRKTANTAAATVDYRRASHSPTDETHAIRDEQLKIRMWELTSAVEALHMIDRGEDVNELHNTDKHGRNGAKDALRTFQNRLDINTPGSLAFAGHSFGATTVVQLLKSAFYHDQVSSPLLTFDSQTPTNKPTILNQITRATPTLLLDPWALPLSSPSTKQLAARPLPAFSLASSTRDPPNPQTSNTEADNVPILAVLSEAFYHWRSNLNAIVQLLTAPHTTSSPHTPMPAQAQAHLYYPTASAHLSQSDFGILFPNLTKRFAKAEEPARTLGLNVRAVLEVLRRQGGAWRGLAQVVSPDDEGEGEKEEDGFVLVGDDDEGDRGEIEEKREGDWRILSRIPGTVRGWVPVPLDRAGGERVQAPAAKYKSKEKVSPATAEPPLGVDDEMRGAQVEREERRQAGAA